MRYGDNIVQNFKLGTQQVQKLYLGEDLVWPSWIDPISLGQPLVYFQTFDTNSPYVNPANPSDATQITSFGRYTDNGLTATGVGNGTFRTFRFSDRRGEIYPYNNGVVRLNGTNSNQRMTFGNNQLFAPYISTGAEYTIYLVASPYALSGDNTGLRVVTMGGALANERCISIWQFYDATPATYAIALNTGDGSEIIGGMGVGDNLEVNEYSNSPLAVYSFRVKDRGIGNLYAEGYINGYLRNSRDSIKDLSNRTTTTTTSSIGGRSNTTTQLSRMDFGEFIFFPTYHSEEVHSSVVEFLCNRWGIDMDKNTLFEFDRNVEVVDGKISSISNQNGLTKLIQNTEANRPTYNPTGWNGLPCYQGSTGTFLDGGKRAMTNHGYTAYILFDDEDITTTQFILGNSNNLRRLMIVAIGSDYRIYNTGAVGTSVPHAVIPRTTGKKLIMWTHNSDAGSTNEDRTKIYVNGVLQTPTFSGGLATMNNRVAYLYLGTRPQATTEAFTGKIAAFGVMVNILSESEVVAFSNNLINKWGL
jgi:hypothetical protein